MAKQASCSSARLKPGSGGVLRISLHAASSMVRRQPQSSRIASIRSGA